MGDELREHDLEALPLPNGWTRNIRHAVLNIIGIVRIAMFAGHEFLVEEGHVLRARIHQLETEVAALREELRINGTRMRRIAPHRRPQFLPVERMAILELRTMCG